MPRYGPGQSGPPPKPPRARARPPAVPATPRTTRADIKATTTVKPARPKTAAQGGAVIRRGTFQPENRKQQAELAAGVRQNAAEQQRQQRQQKLKVAYGRLSVRREQARQRGDAAGIARYDKHLTAMEPHLEAAGLTPKPSKFLDSAYGAVQRAEKVPVAGELLGMVDPILVAKTAISNAKALPDIGTKKFGKGQINAGVVFGKGGEFAKGGEEAGGLKPAGAKAPDLGPDPPGTLYHGSPEGDIGELDPFRHTRAWREGIGFYLTENAKKAEGYARGRTARGDRRTTAAASGKVSGFRLKPGAKVLDMGKPADLSLWRSIAKDHGFSEADFNHYIARQAGEHPTNNRIREELLYQLHDTHGTDAPYELEQAITQRGYHATTHMEGPNRVWVIKDKNAVERVATQSERVAEAMAARKLALSHKLPAEPVVPQEDAAAAKVRASLGPARARRAAQEGLYREERGKRIGRAQSASERAGGGEAGFAAAKAELRGELPKVQFRHLREGNLSQGEFENLLTTVQNHPGLRWYDKIHAQQGLADAFREGKTPQKSQIKHLQTVFGDDATKEIVKASRLAKAGKAAMGVLNIPRSLMASFDLSAPFRQGLVAGVSHPGIFFKNFAPMVKAAGSENFYRAMQDSIEQRPNAPIYHESGLKLTDLSNDAGHREEQFPTEYAEKLNVPVGGGHSVGPGHVVRASARAYTGFLNKMRADMFDHLFEVARKKGVNVEDRKFQRALSSYINSATGRGSLGPAEHMGPALNTFFFSPRLMASRINFLDPTWYLRKSGVGESPFVRKQALKSAGKLAAFGTGVGLAGAAAGGKIGYDPRSSNFGKVKFGNTRLDPLGGFSQYAVAASRIASGKSISSTTGQVSKLGPGFSQLSRKDIVERFFAGKATPTVSFVYDLLQSKDFQGQPLSIKNEVLNRVIPLALQDAYSLEQDTKNIPLGAAGYVASGLGIGLQTYGPKVLKPNTGKFHQKRQEYLDAAKKAGLLPKDAHQQPPEVRKAFALRELREIAYAKAGGHTLDQHQRFEIDQQLLLKRKAITPSQAKTGEAWAKKASDKEIAGFRRELGDRYFGTATLKGATQQINAHGGNVSLR